MFIVIFIVVLTRAFLLLTCFVCVNSQETALLSDYLLRIINRIWTADVI